MSAPEDVVCDNTDNNETVESNGDLLPGQKMVDRRQMLNEMRGHNFDVIRFSTYRTSCKLRFVQKRTNLHLVDIWNMIEAFRENGLNTLDHSTELNTARIENIVSSLFFQLNKRLPNSRQIKAEECVMLLLNFLLSAFDTDCQGKMFVFSIKIALSTLCAGKLVDKLRYVFSQISDSNGVMLKPKFESYLKEVLALPTAVYEGPSFGYNATASRACFNENNSKVTLNDFLDAMMADPGPQCLLWLPLMHRMTNVENVFHPVECSYCRSESMMGFRYKCQRCGNYQLCQNCFWRGNVSGTHTSDHEMKEYSTWKSTAKQLSHNLRKNLRCVPKEDGDGPRYPATPECPLNLKNIVPPPPNPVPAPDVHDFSKPHDSTIESELRRLNENIEHTKLDDEHKLIARYTARLAAEQKAELSLLDLDPNKKEREIIADLERKNREIMKEIQKLRVEHEENVRTQNQTRNNPTLLTELRLLRQRKDELETRMTLLQDSRRELMTQLDGLMKLLKTQPGGGSPKSTPNGSPKNSSVKSLPIIPATSRQLTKPLTSPAESLAGVGGEVRQAFSQSGSRNLHNDLLVAADSVTSAMSSLVKELNLAAENSGDELLDNQLSGRCLIPGQECGSASDISDRDHERKEEADFLAELQARRQGQRRKDDDRRSGVSDDADSFVRDDDSFVATDDGESYVRTDDDESYVVKSDDEDELLNRQTEDEAEETAMNNVNHHGNGHMITAGPNSACVNAEWNDTMQQWLNR